MERFKICEKETKTKAFSKEGLCQQPKTDPKEKAKSETRDWLNNVVNELESQIDSFEAELEGLSVKKGNTKPPRLHPQPSHPPSPIPANGARFSATSAAEIAKRNIMGVESNVQPLTSPLSKIVLPPTAKGNDGTTSDINPSEVAASIGRAFSPSVVSGSQWRPGSVLSEHAFSIRRKREAVFFTTAKSFLTAAPDYSTSIAASKANTNEDDPKGLFDTSSGMPSYMLDTVQEPLVTLTALGPMHDQMHNLQMLEAAYYRLPQPKDSERPRPYTPPKIAADEYEQGAYVYFDFQTPKDESQEGGWCQRIKSEFTFEYCYLEVL
ncbi:hypothetical protein IGI04_004972 [Brassica rapa subsp. trilocularis]|uniref:CCR4-Not complex component Not N-terminal domain-containing protein n=1 Tax=Brassica rapa subsp. trilocularis TaxID=1813537 RepID=A0ABQ7NCP0_BRACM|nr:hypothetical protein IGI04_004972 [Brassica rapa subsp. trilocularis]